MQKIMIAIIKNQNKLTMGKNNHRIKSAFSNTIIANIEIARKMFSKIGC